jgi:hypothetical protein
MTGRVSVFTGMTIRRAIAAQSHTAFLAGPEMHPRISQLHAFHTLKSLRLADIFNRAKVKTNLSIGHIRFRQPGSIELLLATRFFQLVLLIPVFGRQRIVQ